MVALQFEQHCANRTKHTAQRVCVCVSVWLSTCVCVCLQLNGANGRVAAIGSSVFPREHCLYMQRLVLICLPAVFKPLKSSTSSSIPPSCYSACILFAQICFLCTIHAHTQIHIYCVHTYIVFYSSPFFVCVCVLFIVR